MRMFEKLQTSLKTSQVCNALTMITGVIEMFAICRLYRFQVHFKNLFEVDFSFSNQFDYAQRRHPMLCFRSFSFVISGWDS